MDSWPIGLPQKVRTDGFQKVPMGTKVASGVSVGPAKVRSRYTKGVYRYSVQFLLDFDQLSIWDSFYETTLANGAMPFLFEDPFTLTQEAFRIAPDNEPVLRPLGGRVYTLDMVWEKMP